MRSKRKTEVEEPLIFSPSCFEISVMFLPTVVTTTQDKTKTNPEGK